MLQIYIDICQRDELIFLWYIFHLRDNEIEVV